MKKKKLISRTFMPEIIRRGKEKHEKKKKEV